MAELVFNQGDLAATEMGENGSPFSALGGDLLINQVRSVLETVSEEDKTDDVCCCRYWNAATCPDCGAGMVRLGGCFSCQSYGYETCGG
jgi:hypothetical protein